uniref:asparagine--tRNA ligase n=1 Tax=viral metagenome TaxID=1070528 RepID=A0A6C0EJC3_9ZZZZ
MFIKTLLTSLDSLNLENVKNTVYNDTLVVEISGWIKTYRNQREISFMAINDGSSQQNLQVLFDTSTYFAKEEDVQVIKTKIDKLSVGASVELRGILVKPPDSSKEPVELHIIDILHMGPIMDKETYIISKGRVKPEVMRKYQHIRCKTNYFSAIMKIRSQASYALHTFFQNNLFHHLDPNVFTTGDCEGGGETFQVVGPDDICNAGSEDFFKQKTYLTVSSQLHLEACCSGLGRCYTTNPSFRAEKSKTSRHLASFGHVEFEFSFGALNELMDISEEMVKFVITQCLEKCPLEYAFLNGYYSKGVLEKLEKYATCVYPRISYDEALDILEKAKSTKKFKVSNEDMPEWGDDLGSVCERYLAEDHYKSPLMIYNYPKDLKSFYMKADLDNPEVVNCMDMIVPAIGELIGSSVREDDYDKIVSNMEKKSIDMGPLDWYLDLRRNGSWRHAGGGLGFERLVGLLTMTADNFNVRECCPFPVAYGECEY